MSSFSVYLENVLLDHVFGAAAFTAPATLYAAAYTANPSDSGGGTEATGGSYARVSITNNATNFPAASGGAKANGTDITWTTATASWGTITAVALLDASSGGNQICWDALATSKAVGDGDTLEIATGDFDITLD